MRRRPGRAAIATVLLLCLASQANSSYSYWNYRDNKEGEGAWHKKYPECAGQCQSPINIDINQVDVDPSLKPILFRNYQMTNRRFRIRNTGHTVEVMPLDSVVPFIKGGGLNSSYRFVQMHFHWGGADYCGSEHSLNGRFFPMEVHLVHLNNRYRTFREANSQPDGLAILAVFLTPLTLQPISKVEDVRDLRWKMEDYNNMTMARSPLDNPSLQVIVEMLPKVQFKNQRAIINKGINLEGFLPSRRELYFRYSGSLSVPPCSEVVTWTVYPKVIYISRGQLNAFRDLRTGSKRDIHVHRMRNNYRPVQHINNRVVKASYTPFRVNLA